MMSGKFAIIRPRLPMRYRNRIILFALGLLLPILTVIAVYMLARAPVRVDDTLGGATVAFEADRGAVLWRGGCVTVGWQVEGVSAVFLNDAGVIGFGEGEIACVEPRYMPRLTFTVPGSDRLYIVDLPVTIVAESAPVHAAIALGMVLWIVVLGQQMGTRAWWTGQSTEARWALAGLIYIVAFGVAYRVGYVGRPLMLDEANTLYTYGTMPGPYTIMSNYIDPNNHILHSILVHYAIQLGHAAWIFRLPALVAGILIIPLTYAVGRTYYRPSVGLIAAAIAAGNFRLVDYSTDARGYTLLTAITLGLFWLAHGLRSRADGERQWPRWLLFAVLCGLGFFTIPTMYYGLGVVCLWLLLSIWIENKGQARWGQLIRFVLAVGGGALFTLALYSPILLTDPNALFGNFMVVTSDKPPRGFLSEAFGVAWGFFTDGTPALIAWVLVAGMVVSLVFHRRVANHAVPLLPVAVAWVLTVLLVQYIVPLQRLWTWALPMAHILAAAGIVVVVQRIIPEAPGAGDPMPAGTM
ncbi:MAG: glycosyltransferase family 39 protein, partial [Chloroflexota bacterium]